MVRKLPLAFVLMRRAIRAFRTTTGETSGSALVEFAVLAPLLVTLAVYTVDFGLLAFSKMEVQNAAQAGAQYAIGKAGYDSTAIASAVTAASRFTTITPSSSQFCGCPTAAAGVKFCAASCDLCSTGTCASNVQGHYVTVTATPATAYKPLAPFGIASGTFNLTAQSTVRIR
jgi:Flp pilus assembly protein TadG